jgi:hypothetical protein
MAISKSATTYLRRNQVRGLRGNRNFLDAVETAHPRYGKGNTTSHRRGDLRMCRWVVYV